MAPLVRVDLLNLACCAIEAARGFELWRSQAAESGQIDVIDPVEHPDSGSETARVTDLSILIVAGTVTNAQAELVRQRYEALPDPRAVVAFGVCTISGGPYWDSYSVLPGIEGIVPVDVMVPGCPPLPQDVCVALDTVLADRLAGARV